MDRSKIIRHPDVVAAEFERLADRIAYVRRELDEIEDELRQVTGIAHEMMPRRARRSRAKQPSTGGETTASTQPPEEGHR